MYKKLFSLAIPNIITNITVPLVGMVDLAIVGMLDSDVSLAGIAIGTAIFNMLYWNFGFLRMSTSGLAAQSYGKRDLKESGNILVRAISVAMLISLLIILLKKPIENFSLWLMEGSLSVEGAAAEYYRIRVWAAPATLSLYVFKGWFVGMQNSRLAMWVAVSVNIINIVLSYLFAITFQLGLEGVACGTLLAQWSGVIIASIFIFRYYRGRVFHPSLFSNSTLLTIFSTKKLTQFFKLNRDIFVRTVCLVLVFTFFTKASSEMGDTQLSANTILMQLFTLYSYFMDGFAYAGEALSGRYYGSRSGVMLSRSIKAIFRIGLTIAILFTFIFLLFGGAILSMFTSSEQVLSRALESIYWVSAIPLVGYAAFLWDGILVGMTKSLLMMNSMLLATFLFFLLYYALGGVIGWGESLWIAFLVYLLARGLFQWYFYNKKDILQ